MRNMRLERILCDHRPENPCRWSQKVETAASPYETRSYRRKSQNGPFSHPAPDGQMFGSVIAWRPPNELADTRRSPALSARQPPLFADVRRHLPVLRLLCRQRPTVQHVRRDGTAVRHPAREAVPSRGIVTLLVALWHQGLTGQSAKIGRFPVLRLQLSGHCVDRLCRPFCSACHWKRLMMLVASAEPSLKALG
jgi:hypothetical protein